MGTGNWAHGAGWEMHGKEGLVQEVLSSRLSGLQVPFARVQEDSPFPLQQPGKHGAFQPTPFPLWASTKAFTASQGCVATPRAAAPARPAQGAQAALHTSPGNCSFGSKQEQTLHRHTKHLLCSEPQGQAVSSVALWAILEVSAAQWLLPSTCPARLLVSGDFHRGSKSCTGNCIVVLQHLWGHLPQRVGSNVLAAKSLCASQGVPQKGLGAAPLHNRALCHISLPWLRALLPAEILQNHPCTRAALGEENCTQKRGFCIKHPPCAPGVTRTWCPRIPPGPGSAFLLCPTQRTLHRPRTKRLRASAFPPRSTTAAQ